MSIIDDLTFILNFITDLPHFLSTIGSSHEWFPYGWSHIGWYFCGFISPIIMLWKFPRLRTLIYPGRLYLQQQKSKLNIKLAKEERDLAKKILAKYQDAPTEGYFINKKDPNIKICLRCAQSSPPKEILISYRPHYHGVYIDCPVCGYKNYHPKND